MKIVFMDLRERKKKGGGGIEGVGGREKGFNKCSLSNWLLLKKPRLLSSRILTFVQVKVFKCRGRQMQLAVRTGGDRKKHAHVRTCRKGG